MRALFYLLTLMLISQPSYCQEEVLLGKKKILTIYSFEFSNQITSEKIQERIWYSFRQALSRNCVNLDIRRDFGLTTPDLSETDELKIEGEIRNILAEIIQSRSTFNDNLELIKSRISSHYLLLGKINYYPQSEDEEYELLYNIILLDNMSDISVGGFNFGSKDLNLSKLRDLMTLELSEISFCGSTDLGKDNLRNLRKELYKIAKSEIVSPNDNSISNLISEFIYPNPNLKALFLLEKEKVIEEKIGSLVPKNDRVLTNDEKNIIKVYYSKLENLFYEIIQFTPELMDEYSQRIEDIKRHKKFLNLD